MLHEIWDMVRSGARDEETYYPDWSIAIARGGTCCPGVGLNIQYEDDNKHYSDCIIIEHPIILGLDLIRHGFVQMPFDLWRKITNKHK